MQVIHAPSDQKPLPEEVCLAIGFFDGVHLGHQEVIRQAVADAQRLEAQAVVITFDQHPRSVVAPERIPPLIYPLHLKLRAIAGLGVQATLLIHFDETFSRQTGEEFIRILDQSWARIRSISVGGNFKFGFQRSGTVASLERLGRELDFTVYGLPAVSLDGEVISSTRIRETIRRGDLDAVGPMLGRPYTLGGRVVRGDRIGQKLGFPTANLDASGMVLPPPGVYAVRAHLKEATHRAVLNIGWRPTLRQTQPQLRVEAHLLDFQGDLYDSELELSFVCKLRDEKRFASLETLQTQIREDIAAARACFARGK
jgi:riboflavin kinase/FMN adenylyltransferase